jgi:DNA polymerase-3 subunit epsilon
MSWSNDRLAAFDIETTGVNPQNDRIVTAAVSVVGGGESAEDHAWLVNPGVEIPEGAARVHGITTEMARADGVQPAAAVEQITSLLASQILNGVPIIAFNARFDLTALHAEALRNEVQPLVDRIGGAENLLVIDPLILDKQLDRYRKGKRQLGVVCEVYGVQLDDAHTANADALAAARVAWKLAQKYSEEVGQLELRALHDQQIIWAAEQATSLQEYFDRQGKNEVVEQAWPIVFA